jgi:zinc transporter ZupT
MHEIPPMEHVRRRTTVDLHHAIIPRVSRFAFPPQQLMASAIEIFPGVFVLSTADRIIHSAIHAFLEGVPTKALRDIYDITRLVKQHFPKEQEHEVLLARARQLGLGGLVTAALEASEIIFRNNGTPPHRTAKNSLRGRCLAIAAQSPLKPGLFSGSLMAQVLLAHSHWMKMPWHLLIPHLARKAWIGLIQKNTTA